MDFKKLESHEVVSLSDRDDERAGKAQRKILEFEVSRLREINERFPKISDDVPKDFRYVAGQIDMINRILGLAEEAQALRQRAEQQSKRS